MSAMFSRRGFIQAAALSLVGSAYAPPGAAGARRIERPYGSRLGLEAFTVAQALDQDPRTTLRRLAEIGYKEVELDSINRLPAIAPLAREYGLRIVSSLTGTFFPQKDSWAEWVRTNPSAVPVGLDLEETLRLANAHGLEYLGYPAVAPPEAWVDEAAFVKFCALMDRVGARCRKAGITFAYHNHFHEFASAGTHTFFELLMQRTRPENMAFEVDVCWAAHGGQDPAALISRLRGRVPLIHLKDRRPGAPVSTGQEWPEGNIFAEVGHGTLDVPAILKAARESGVKHVFVEQDETEGDPVDSLAKSFAFVSSRGL